MKKPKQMPPPKRAESKQPPAVGPVEPPPWTSWVIECLREDGTFDQSQVAGLLRFHSSDNRSGLQKMQRFEEIGLPEARTKLLIKGGHHAIVRPDTEKPDVWELKTNPHPWRFYFQIDELQRFITYAYATYKKKTEADAGAVASARGFIARLIGRTARRRRIDLS